MDIKKALKIYEFGYEDGFDKALTLLGGIKRILINEKKKVISVSFVDGDTQISRCCEEDTFDVNVGVSLCIAQHTLENKRGD